MRTEWRVQGDIDVLFLGEIPVGRVHLKDKSWIFNLNYPGCFWKGERSLDRARACVNIALTEWLRKAGLVQAELFA